MASAVKNDPSVSSVVNPVSSVFKCNRHFPVFYACTIHRFLPYYTPSFPKWVTPFCYGGVAQLVEQVTLNHWVHGSSPCAPTISFLFQRSIVGYFFLGLIGCARYKPGGCLFWLSFVAFVSTQTISGPEKISCHSSVALCEIFLKRLCASARKKRLARCSPVQTLLMFSSRSEASG